ncbi:MAG: kelch repeat-containing protein [Flavobacteriales bacterium]
MLRRSTFSLILIFSVHLSTAQNNQWTWMDGHTTRNNTGDYPILRNPGSRSESATWTDTSGNFWLFGGFGLDFDGSLGRMNDLWKYNTSTDAWTWMTGSNSTYEHGSYGTQGTAAASILGSKAEASWVDNAGNLWLFGGFGYAASGSWGDLNDLWKYDPSTNQWTWMKGSNVLNASATYGTLGTAAAPNTPGAREGSVTWTDDSGDLWLFGGWGYDASGSSGYLNDVWRYSPSTNQWTWIKGSSSINPSGSYGTLGTASASNTPGGRGGAVSWTDAQGNFWLFGGYNNFNYRNDLWKYNPSTNQWTWMKGSSGLNQNGIHGTQGTAASTNTPGARYASAGWADTLGNLWLFGGYGCPGGSTSSTGNLNDLWKYDTTTNEWTWMKGSGGWNQNGTYGTQGTSANANTPGGREKPAAWLDTSGNLWLFAGYGYPATGSTSGYLNDLWKYSPTINRWTWIKGSNSTFQDGIYGKKGSEYGQPGPRYVAANWIDSLGNFWLFGGHGYGRHNVSTGKLEDLWKYEPSINRWTWVKGSNSTNQGATYGTLGTAAVSNTPGGRSGSAALTDTLGNLWLFGGNSNSARHNDLWKYDLSTNQWTWIKGSNSANQNGIYGTQGTASSTNTPGARHELMSWKDASGNFWLFGGHGYAATGGAGYLNDLWKYDPSINQWTWMKGNNAINQSGSYGTQGIAASTNNPSARLGSATWTDTLGNLWLFGGLRNGGELNDLWKYDPSTNEWTWVKGSNTIDQNGTYGTQGIASYSNNPGARRYSVGWTDTSGNFWLFGGLGLGATSTLVDALNDLWKYYPSSNQWVWVKGSSSTNQIGTYGTQGSASSTNTPGARYASATWINNAGALWLFGGVGHPATSGTGYLSDLWRYHGDTCNAPAAPTNTTVTSNLIICAGDSTTLSASGSGDLIWYASDTSAIALDSKHLHNTSTRRYHHLFCGELHLRSRRQNWHHGDSESCTRAEHFLQ